MPKVECEVCGGTDFYKESGHYFCNECQTQTQEIQEHVFEEELVKFNVKSTRKIEKNRDKSENNITSWECYNIILCKLTDQLIELGADKKLKPIVRYLWMSYLEKLEIIKPGEDIPKLPAVNYRKDAEIIYGIKTSRKRRRSVSSRSGSEATLNTSVSLKRERSRKKRALAESQLEEIAQKSTQESTSLYNETLTSIKSSSDKSSPSVMYNQYVLKELRKKCGKTHLKRHSSNVSMKCHKIKHSNISYKHKVTLLTPTKLYCILYVGLMINKDDIQIGDLLRFINDGHISFNYYRNLFPDDFHHKNLNIRDNSVKRTLTNFSFRKNVAQMINFLNLHKYITKPDLPKLCRRFCKELNLPDDLTNYVVNIVNKTSPKLNFAKNSTIFPNYEGRIMSVILVVLKLLFGFDDVTEYEFSRYSQLCDEYITFPKMFNVVDWMKYLHYRSVIIDEYHFPTQYNNNQTTVDSDLYLQFTSTKPPQFDEDMQLNKYMSQYKQLLLKLKDLQQNFNVGLEFEPSLTQSYNYCRFLSKSESNKPYQHEILNYESSNHSMDYLLKPNSFLKLINKGKHVDTVHHGANQNWKMKRIENLYTENKQTTELTKML
ncbi:TATA box-binding protein-associated factor RNA polymerase I subunit B isoform X2 [Aethina tumida]|uniref:TATA box-binding protein-associated factor RNA polymerase I subunit B isoform X2 n=1 Tax=Aethina tumida TaxID=116153 RepID=UPI0021480BF3|nr:TATA box-binding protein-associated factor RNA polymerase I subunit B isoform X2 [Aethina tumida]